MRHILYLYIPKTHAEDTGDISISGERAKCDVLTISRGITIIKLLGITKLHR